MGATAKRPTFLYNGDGIADSSSDMQRGRRSSDSGFYENALNQQKQAVANVPATQAAQAQPGTTPNRPEPSFLNQPAQTSTGSPAPNLQAAGTSPDNQYSQAYDTYMQRSGGVGIPGARPQQSESPGEMAQQFGGRGAPTDRQRMAFPGAAPGNQQGRPRRKGITMGGGYASREFD